MSKCLVFEDSKHINDIKCDATRKIIDCFTFYNELELLYYRLNLLYTSVDHFIIVESNYTHAGHKKELYYKNNEYIFKKFSDKIIHIIVDLPFIFPNIDYNNNEQWINENFQRNCIDNGIQQLQLHDTDLIIISDLDEIISPNKLSEIRQQEIVDGFTLLLDFYYYNLNCKICEYWQLTKIVTFKKYKETTPQSIRDNSPYLPKIPKCGWHLSYFGNAKFIKNKLIEFSHQEYNSDYFTNLENIDAKIANGTDLFDRKYLQIQHIKIEDNAFLPPNYNLYLNNYYKIDQQPILGSHKIIIYFHICCINHWRDIVSNLLFKIKHSGLYDKVFEIRCTILGSHNNDPIFNDAKIKILYESNDMSLHEKCIINILYEDSKNDDFYVLYIHSKGVKHLNLGTESNVYDWTDYMGHFNIYHHSKCIELLQDNDTVGVNLQISHDYPLHYSGNFWWSKTSHIRNLKIITDNYYNSCEFWVTNHIGKYVSLWNSNIHHYNNHYKFTEYENKEIIPIFQK